MNYILQIKRNSYNSEMPCIPVSVNRRVLCCINTVLSISESQHKFVRGCVGLGGIRQFVDEVAVYFRE